MIIAIDVHYRENLAKTVSIEFENWNDKVPEAIHTTESMIKAEYQPGEFYKRELPCILGILKLSALNKCLAIIIDGYVVLSDDGKPGLGGYLYEKLDRKIPVIGVAKKRFYKNNKQVVQVFRGKSKKPLFITCKGLDLDKAAKFIKSMAGNYRIPDLLKILDQKTKLE